MTSPSFRKKIIDSIRIDRAFFIVWSAGRKWTIISAAITTLQGIMPLVSLYILKLVIDTVNEAIQSNTTDAALEKLLFLILIAICVAIVQSACQHAGEYVNHVLAETVTDYTTNMIHEKSVDLDLSYYESSQYYDTLHRAQREAGYRPTQIVQGLIRLIRNLVSLMAMAGLLFMFHWSVGILLLASVLPSLGGQISHARRNFAWQQQRTNNERKAMYFSTILTNAAFAKELRLFDIGGYFTGLYVAARNILRTEKLKLSKNKNRANFYAQSFSTLILMGCLFFMAYRAVQGNITLGDMVMYFQAFQRGLNHLKELLFEVADLYEANLFIAHFFDFLDIENRIQDPLQPVPVPECLSQGISLQNIAFSYSDKRETVLRDVSLTIHPGEIVALVGANGAGKSTLVKLLCRLHDPEKGEITFDGTNFTHFQQKELRKQISVVFQDFGRYFLSVRENIWIGDTDLSKESKEIQTAAAKADALSFIQTLPQGLDTTLGKWFADGEEISLGEWQKIVLARAFLRKSQLIILDEPTSSLDVHTEYYLHKKFRELIAGRSALIISHRFSTVKMADRIYVLEDGVITESGSHEELIAQNKTYAQMYAKQKSWSA